MKKTWMTSLLIGVALSGHAGSPPKELLHGIEALRLKMKVPGASIAVISQGKIAWAKGLGYADIKSNRRMTKTTLLQACSITKTLTSTAALKILKKHKIFLDEPVNRYLKGWKIPLNSYTQKVPVSFRMLLNHTAAMSNPYPQGGGGYAFDKPMPTLLQVLQGIKPALNKPVVATRVPGSSYQYCNGCYTVLQDAIESIVGNPYPEIIKKQIFEPAGMLNSVFDNALPQRNPERIALPYDLQHKLYQLDRSPIYSTGGLWTTASDLASFGMNVTQALQKNSPFLSKSLAWLLITPSSTPTRGLGFFIGDKDGRDTKNGHYIYHSGQNIGYLSLLIISKDGKNGAAILINISSPWDSKTFPKFEFIQKSLGMISAYYQWKNK
jgi:CubicO group peptidase (beta-lactamase class C family)